MRRILTALAAAAILLLLAADPAAGQTGSVSGVITDANGAPIASRHVYLYSAATPNDSDSAWTNGSGIFTFASLAAGTYYVITPDTGTSAYVGQIYGTSCPLWRCTYRDGAPIAVAAGQGVTGIDLRLLPGGSVVGQLLDATTGGPLTLERTYRARLYDEFGHPVGEDIVYQLKTSYAFGRLHAGRYHLLIEAYFESGHASEFADGRHCSPRCAVTAGTPFEVVDGAERTMNVTLDRAGRITGRLIAHATGQTITSGIVSIRSVDGTFEREFHAQWPSYEYDAVVPPGQYTVLGSAFSGIGMAAEYFGGIHARCDTTSSNPDQCAQLRRLATPVVVAPGVTRSGIDIRLDAGGAIAGSLTVAGPPAAAVDITVLTPGGVVVKRGVGWAPGSYQVRELPPGIYYVCASDPGAVKTQAFGGLEFDTPTCPPSTGTPVAVVSGGTTSAVNFTLQSLRPSATGFGVLNGTVRQTNGQPLGGLIQVYGEVGAVRSFGHVDANGTYSMILWAGRYFVRTEASGSFVDEWSGNVCAICGDARGTLVTIEAGATRTIDFELAPGASIQARVTPIGASVGAYDANGRLLKPSSGFGPYTVDGLPPGAYYLRTRTSSPVFADVVYPNVPCLSSECPVSAGTPITLAAGQTVTGITLNLIPAGIITGRAVTRDGLIGDFARPLRFNVEALDAHGQPAGRLKSFDSALGYYEIDGLAAGTYYVRTTDGAKLGMVNQTWREIVCASCPITDATPVVVNANAYTDHIDFALAPGGAITGLVVESGSGTPLEHQRVEARSLTGSLVASSMTAADGSYLIDGLPGGQFYVQTATTLGYVDERYHSTPCVKCAVGDGLPVTVALHGTTPGINFALVTGGRVAGRVKGGDSGVAGIRVSAVDTNGTVVGSTVSEASGAFLLSAPAGSAFARVDPEGSLAQIFDRQTCPGGVCNLALATPLAIQAGQLRTGVDFPLSACSVPAILPGVLPTSIVSHAYSTTLTGAGGTSPYRFSLLAGSLPPGVTLHETTGALSGTITQAGSYALTVSAADALGCSTEKSFGLEVKGCDVALSTEHLSFLTAGGQRSLQIAAACAWQASTTASWVTVTTSGNSVTVAVAANPGDTRYGRVTIGGRSLAISQASLTSGFPFGAVDVPNDGSTVRGSIAVGGWALDDVEVQRIAIYRDALGPEPAGQLIYIGDAVRVRGARPDVEAFFPHLPLRDRAGWGFLLLTNVLPGQGNGTIRLHAYAVDVEGNSTLLGSRTIVAANAGATVPFGAIDTPGQGETISGASYINFGWALTPMPKTIPVNGATITVLVDGVARGTVDYNHYRGDVATLFPGRSNSNGAVGFTILDTTQLANGIHTISWTVTDDAGATEGIGSRYFHVDNLTSPITAAVSDDAQASSGEMASAQSVMRSALAVHTSGTTTAVIRAREMERITVDLRSLFKAQTCVASYVGTEIVGDDRRPLPAGSSLDSTSGAFAWQPGPGFLGRYQLLFTAMGCDRSESTVTIDVRILRAFR